jgi:hypothetical protein
MTAVVDYDLWDELRECQFELGGRCHLGRQLKAASFLGRDGRHVPESTSTLRRLCRGRWQQSGRPLSGVAESL